MEIRYLRAFLAICEELLFGRAAARLHIAQPTLSDHLRHLERTATTCCLWARRCWARRSGRMARSG